MPNTKLTKDGIMSLFNSTDKNYITSSLIMKEFNVTRSTVAKRLRKMIDKGLIKRGEVQHKYYRSHIDYLTADEVKKQLIQYWNDNDHPAIKAIPQHHGGKMTSKGSGIMSTVKYVINSLIEMDLINNNL